MTLTDALTVPFELEKQLDVLRANRSVPPGFDPTGAPMEYLYIAGTVLAMAGGTLSFAALQWPRLFAIARRYDRSDLRKCAERRDLACRNRAPEFVDSH